MRSADSIGRDIRHNHPEMTTRLFPNESLEWPGFVELDEINRKVVTFSNRDWYVSERLRNSLLRITLTYCAARTKCGTFGVMLSCTN